MFDICVAQFWLPVAHLLSERPSISCCFDLVSQPGYKSVNIVKQCVMSISITYGSHQVVMFIDSKTWCENILRQYKKEGHSNTGTTLA